MKNCQYEVPIESAQHLVRSNALRQRFQRIRSKQADYGPNPPNLESIEIPMELTKTYDAEPFLYADSGLADPNRVIIFATPTNIQFLKAHATWFGDGTFAVSPSLFYQLYTINIITKGKNLPLIYALLPDKQQNTYSKMYVMLLKSFTENEFPKSFTHDFEKGALNSIVENFTGINIFGCYFHFAQNLWKQMQQKKLSLSYINNKEIRFHYKLLKALCFVPPPDVINAFNLISKTAPASFIPMLTYLETY